MRKRSWIFKTVLLVAIIGGLLWFNHSVLHLSPTLIQKWIISFGWAAPVLYILIYTVRPLILFPASILSLTGGLAFGPLWGMLYTVIGATMGAVLSFISARVLGKRLIQKKWVGQWHKVEKQLEERGFLYILILRLIPLFPFDLISYASGVSKVKLTAFFFGTLLGIVPGTFVYNFLGSSFVHGKNHDIVIAAAAFILVLLIPIFLKRKISKQKGERISDEKI
jgi:uncharacterized membrane protein YdjX (TVP38/TMEM64 family)